MKNLVKGIRFIMLLMLTAFPVQAEIISAKSMKEIQAKIEGILKTQKAGDILLALDINMTLTQPNHPAVYYPAIRKYADVYKSILGQLTLEQKDLAVTLTTQIVPQKLVEQEIPQILNHIQKEGVKVIALTSSLAGKIKGFQDKMVVLRRNGLQKMGVNFTKTFKKSTRVATFFDFKRYAGGYPMFYHGILSTNGEGSASKGDVLVAFLRHVGIRYESKAPKSGYFPKVVILADDRRKHLENVEESLKAYDPSIRFIGIAYEGAYTYAPQDNSSKFSSGLYLKLSWMLHYQEQFDTNGLEKWYMDHIFRQFS